MPAKVIAVDADGVLWGNVLGEEGIRGIILGGSPEGKAFQDFQDHLLRLKKQGCLLAVVSRNELADVQEVFDQHPGMRLKRDDIAAWGVGWRPKSGMLLEIARSLNVGIDSIVFIDDDEANRLEIPGHAAGSRRCSSAVESGGILRHAESTVVF